MSVSPAGRPVVLWFRRDLRLDDHQALVAAARQGPVVPLFVLDDALLGTAGHGVEPADSLARYHRVRSQRDLAGTAPCSSH